MAIKVIAQRRLLKIGKNPGEETGGENQGGGENQNQGGGTLNEG